MPAPATSDAELVARTLAGSREAFGEIVARYQTLICSVTYSATGSLTQSQDLTQETFLTAWKQLTDLRQPASLRAWLCGIARNLNYRARRNQHREPTHAAEPLDAVIDSAGPEVPTADHVISREEESIMWRALERIPESFREPLILFYRQHHSVEQVAKLLDLSEEAVRQRLSRGRKLLEEEVTTFVEGTLRRSAPGPAFCAMVVAALPANAGLSAGLAAAKGGAFSALAFLFIGLASSLLGSVGLVGLTDSPSLRRFTIRILLAMWGDCVALWIALPLSQWLRLRHAWPDRTFALFQTGCYFLWSAVMAALVIRFLRGYLAHHRGNNRSLVPVPTPTAAVVLVTAAMTVGSLAWLVQLAWIAGDLISIAVSLFTGVAVFAWAIVFPRRLQKSGFDPARLASVPAALISGVILALLNWRLDLWVSVIRHTDLGAAHRFLPMGIIHLATILLVLWIAVLVLGTRPHPHE